MNVPTAHLDQDSRRATRRKSNVFLFRGFRAGSRRGGHYGGVYYDQSPHCAGLHVLSSKTGGFDVPRKIVDFSARSAYLREEPFHLHFWENSVEDYLSFLRDPRGQLEQIGIHLPPDCRIETVIENHDWLAQKTAGLASDNGTIICNVGTGNVARAVYRIVSYAHSHDAIGSHKKELLHGIDEEERA
jgi:hypothetical protein